MNMWTSRIILVVVFLLGACGEVIDSKGLDAKAVNNTVTRPNVLLVVADDMGYTDIAPFGGEINTPNLQMLANNGLRLSRFYAGMTCSPSRAMLMSGSTSHVAGLGNMIETVTDNQLGKPGYEGYLSKRVLSLAELLQGSGYNTYMAGKWHLGNQYDQSPRARGFDRSFSFIYGGGSHFNDMIGPDAHRPRLRYREDGEFIDGLLKGYYSTKNFTDKMLEYIGSHANDGKPFFGYLAYTAPHWPLQVPAQDRGLYKGRYDQGYDVFRTSRFERLKALGLVPADMQLPPRPTHIPAWDTLSPEQQAIQTADMEIYAAMVDYMDRSIGRITDYLKEEGLYDNTIIFFMSDNGAEAWSTDTGPKALKEYAKTFDNQLQNRGGKNSFVFYGPGWANVGEVPFRQHKGTTAEGGIRVPALVSWPKMNTKLKGSVNGNVVSIQDVLPTIMELTGSTHPGTNIEGRNVLLPTGRSFAPLLLGGDALSKAVTARVKQNIFTTEIWGRRGIVMGDWKGVYMAPPLGTGEWELFNVSQDIAEQHDLAKSHPQILARIQSTWADYARDNGVILPEGPFGIRPPQPVPR